MPKEYNWKWNKKSTKTGNEHPKPWSPRHNIPLLWCFYLIGVASRLIHVFSLYETVPRLIDTTPKPNQLQGLDGIRFFSMTWVILGHVWSFSVQAAYPSKWPICRLDLTSIWYLAIDYLLMLWFNICFAWFWLLQLCYWYLTANGLDAALQGRDGDWTFSGVVGGLFAVDSFFLLRYLMI